MPSFLLSNQPLHFKEDVLALWLVFWNCKQLYVIHRAGGTSTMYQSHQQNSLLLDMQCWCQLTVSWQRSIPYKMVTIQGMVLQWKKKHDHSQWKKGTDTQNNRKFKKGMGRERKREIEGDGKGRNRGEG